MNHSDLKITYKLQKKSNCQKELKITKPFSDKLYNLNRTLFIEKLLKATRSIRHGKHKKTYINKLYKK